jgi:hypothetical protein
MEIDLRATPTDFIWNKLFSRDRRWRIRRFERDGYEAREAQTKNDLQDFYKLHVEEMKYLRVPPQPYNFIENWWNILHPKNLRIWLVRKENPMGGIAVFKDERKTYWFLAGLDRRRAGKYPLIPYLVWKEIKRAEEEGYGYLSLGGTPSDPTHSYYVQKASFGATFRQQEILFLPFNSIGYIMVQTRAKASLALKEIRKVLTLVHHHPPDRRK